MSNESTVWKNLTVNATIIPQEPGTHDGYVLLLVLLSIFLGGTLVLLSVLLIVCRRCCEGDRRYSRASDDSVKTSPAAYPAEAQPVHEITIRVDESDRLSTSSCHDVETERFLSTGTTGRRVSFNEAALFDHGKKTQEKGRRYTLTEGDFHHLKNARLTHLHLPPPTLKIVTIHECESSENSIAMTTCPAFKPSLSIFQPPAFPLPQTALMSLNSSPNSALPGDALNSTVDASFGRRASKQESPWPGASEAMGAGPRKGGGLGASEGVLTARGAASANASPGTVLQFFSKLRRHASLEGSSPYFNIKKWKFDSNQRASSLDTRGSPKRRQFQRQRAASESMDREEQDAQRMDIIQYIFSRHEAAPSPAFCPRTRPPTPTPTPTPTPPPSLGRLDVEVVVEASCTGGRGLVGISPETQEEAAGVESVCPQKSTDHQTLYSDIWTLRASLEKNISSDHSSNNDRDSARSDGDSECSLGSGAALRGLLSYPSQDTDEEPEAGAEFAGEEGLNHQRKQDSVDSERGSDGEAGNRKLLQMDSGYASIEAPARAPEEVRLFGGTKDRTASEKRRFFTSAGRKGTVCDSFQASLEEESEEGATPCGSVECESPTGCSPYGQMFPPRDPLPKTPLQHPRRRDFSVDEKTDALFHEFLRHDPQYDQQESPLRSKHRSRVHLRKHWQRSKQHSDPGVRFAPTIERHRTPLRRGDSVNCPLDTCYKSTLPRIVSAPDEEADAGAGWPGADQDRISPSSSSSSQTIKEEEGRCSCSTPPAPGSALEPSGRPESPVHHGPAGYPPGTPPPPGAGHGPQTAASELTDKLAANLEERLYTSLRRTKKGSEYAVTATHASTDPSPV